MNTQQAPEPLARGPGTEISRRDWVLKTALSGLALTSPLGQALALGTAQPGPSASKPRNGGENQESVMYAYVGSRTTRERNARGDGITVYQVAPLTGKLTTIQVVDDLVNPSYLVLNHDKSHLYAVHGDLDYVSAFKLDAETGKLSFLNRQTTQGNNPVHLAIDPTGRYLVVSNHLGGTLAVLPIAADGSLQPLTQLLKLEGPIGPHRIEQTQAKPHFNGFDPTGEYVIVPDKGLDRVFSFRFKDGRLVPAAKPFAVVREGAGPRHHVFHTQLAVCYVVNELDSSVTTYVYNAGDGSLAPVQRLSTLPDSFTGDSRASGIMIAPDGKHLYASNRGHESIAVFAIDPVSGHLRFVEAASSQGSKPRFFTINPSGTLLYVLNEDSDTIVTLAIDHDTGRLTRAQGDVHCGSPVCMVFA